MRKEELIKELENTYKGKKLYHKDFEMILDWDLFIDIYNEYADTENETIHDYINIVTDRNSNCELIEA